MAIYRITFSTTIFFLLLFIPLIKVDAQNEPKYFQSIGLSIPFLDIMKSPVQLVSYPVTISNSISIEYVTNTANSRFYGISLATFIYRFRYNIFESSENKAFGLSISPAIGISYQNGHSDYGNQHTRYVGHFKGFGHFNLPILLEYEFGAGATKISTIKRGCVFGIGGAYTLLPFLRNSGFPSFSYLQLALAAGYRYINKNDKLREINLLIGVGGDSYNSPNDAKWMDGRSFSGRLSYIRPLRN